jgi:hypothetical protein
MASTEPLLVEVVKTAQVGPAVGPKRISLPSRLPRSRVIGRSANASVGAASNQTAPVIFASSRTSITPNTTAAWRVRPMIRPNIQTQAIGIRMIATIASALVQKFGFSNGWVEFGPKKPPPLVPSCLIARKAATGPRAIACPAPSKVVA